MLLAIGLQESRLAHRRQIGGPARGYWQFEQGGGVLGVLTHLSSIQHIHAVLQALDYPTDRITPEHCYVAIEHNDILAAAFARLLLWTLPTALPGREDAQAAWTTYIQAWRPGRPHRASWDDCHRIAWETVSAA